MEMGQWMGWRGGIDEEDDPAPGVKRAQPEETKSDENQILQIMARKGLARRKWKLEDF